ncbi:hypothetical protein, partial [Anaerotignum lactatifermentans]|uniref:hypothetical protein n=1 Tax=Anaerotignum lactatifermentans TaxID=160404 RepID=UPI003AF14B6D
RLSVKKVCLLYNQYKGYEERKQDEKSFPMDGSMITAESSTAVVGYDAVNAIQEDSAKSWQTVRHKRRKRDLCSKLNCLLVRI